MLGNRLVLESLTALMLSMPAAAQEQSRTKTFEGPNVSAAQTTTGNRETGAATRDREVTNLDTGNTAQQRGAPAH